MQINTPFPFVRDGDYTVRLNSARPERPFAVIALSEDGRTSLAIESVADADRLIKAACEAKRLLVAGPPPVIPKPYAETAGVCGERQPGGKSLCTRPDGHAGGHRNEATDAYWPQSCGEA